MCEHLKALPKDMAQTQRKYKKFLHKNSQMWKREGKAVIKFRRNKKL